MNQTRPPFDQEAHDRAVAAETAAEIARMPPLSLPYRDPADRPAPDTNIETAPPIVLYPQNSATPSPTYSTIYVPRQKT